MLHEFKGRGEYTSEMGIWCPELGWNSQWDCGGAQWGLGRDWDLSVDPECIPAPFLLRS